MAILNPSKPAFDEPSQRLELKPSTEVLTQEGQLPGCYVRLMSSDGQQATFTIRVSQQECILSAFMDIQPGGHLPCSNLCGFRHGRSRTRALMGLAHESEGMTDTLGLVCPCCQLLNQRGVAC